MGIIKEIENKRILILGFGREGESTYDYIRHFLPHKRLSIADSRNLENDKIKLDRNLDLYLGENYLDTLKKHDFVFKSPGISLKEIEISKNCQISSQTDMFLKYYGNQTIGITGTKGKSTTTALIFHILKSMNKKALMAGNMGKPLFDIIPEIDQNSVIVAEFSSHQLEFIQKGPRISVILNLFQEHLDHYLSYEHYKKAKLNIALFQDENDYFISPNYSQDIEKSPYLKEIKSKFLKFGYDSNLGNYISENQLFVKNNLCGIWQEDFPLLGEHNMFNALLALVVLDILGMDTKEAFGHIKSFEALSHRLEFVGEYGKIKFYNDSISTIPQATLEALKAVKNVDTLILGGFDRGIEYEDFIKEIIQKDLKNIIFTGEAGIRMMNIAENLKNPDISLIFLVSYDEIVEYCFLHTKQGKACLLSPAAASYDKFKNFEERGEVFKKLVKKISDKR
ncbi:MAG: UDP-N-acetylmuramoyl-L-alanine--D-glutamate ligase [Bacteroidales bacterium]|jgi:UDP-N-acetylmuramoylalanine--D-glutamate ligase|nr:UDP-N-acetylmuramoyl-L-alanine--D-glutamate ligase [Bacteroidales bacterium]